MDLFVNMQVRNLTRREDMTWFARNTDMEPCFVTQSVVDMNRLMTYKMMKKGIMEKFKERKIKPLSSFFLQ